MLTLKGLITGDIGDSPSDRIAAPIALLVGFPIILPCAVGYYTVKGVQKVVNNIKEKQEAKNYDYEKVTPVTPMSTDSSSSFYPPVDTYGKKRSKKLTLRIK